MNNNLISRREFAAAAGGALVLAATARAATSDAGPTPFHTLVHRCGELRLGYCSIGGIAPGDIEARHAEHLALLLSLCDVKDIRAHYSAGAATSHRGQRPPTTLMSTLAVNKGLRLEVVTTGAGFDGPELSLRGNGGILCVANGKVYFNTSTKILCPWRNEENAQPDACWKAFLASRHSWDSRTLYIKEARKMAARATASLC